MMMNPATGCNVLMLVFLSIFLSQSIAKYCGQNEKLAKVSVTIEVMERGIKSDYRHKKTIQYERGFEEEFSDLSFSGSQSLSGSFKDIASVSSEYKAAYQNIKKHVEEYETNKEFDHKEKTEFQDNVLQKWRKITTTLTIGYHTATETEVDYVGTTPSNSPSSLQKLRQAAVDDLNYKFGNAVRSGKGVIRGPTYIEEHCSKACKPYTEETCRAVAEKLGLSLGDANYPFVGDYHIKGCYAYEKGSWSTKRGYGPNVQGGTVFYGTGGTITQKSEELSGMHYRPEGYDCKPAALCAILYNDKNFKGKALRIKKGAHNLDWNNKKVSSIELMPGCILHQYYWKNLDYHMQKITSSKRSLGGFDDDTSSVDCYGCY